MSRYVKAKDKSGNVWIWNWVTPDYLVDTLLEDGFKIIEVRGYGILDELSNLALE